MAAKWRLPDESYIFANYSVLAKDPNEVGPSNEKLVLVMGDGTRYYPDRRLTEQFDSGYIMDSAYSGAPYYTTDKLSTTGWHDHFAIFLVPVSKVSNEAQLRLVE